MTLCHVMWYFVTVICDIMLTLNSKSENKKIKRNRKRNGNKLSLPFLILTLMY